MNIFKTITNTYNKISNWGKILIFILLLLIVVVFLKDIRPKKEGFEQNDDFLFKTNLDAYDDFYVNIYDHLLYNNLKDQYEIGEIINKTKPTSESIILDIGSGTGHHVAQLASNGLNVQGVDISEAMVKKSQENYPQYNFVQGDVRKASTFKNNSFTHILCLYFTIYHMENKSVFFTNCMNWLMPGGYLIIHVVDRDMFDPILPPGNPLIMVSPQRYAKQRITQTRVTFNDMDYTSNFDLDSNKNIATFNEKFKHKDSGKVRKNQHILYMDSEQDILTMAQNAGFIVEGKIDLLQCRYEYQYLYILVKPN
jgi:SAM-dependent methyltransferase